MVSHTLPRGGVKRAWTSRRAQRNANMAKYRTFSDEDTVNRYMFVLGVSSRLAEGILNACRAFRIGL